LTIQRLTYKPLRAFWKALWKHIQVSDVQNARSGLIIGAREHLGLSRQALWFTVYFDNSGPSNLSHMHYLSLTFHTIFKGRKNNHCDDQKSLGNKTDFDLILNKAYANDNDGKGTRTLIDDVAQRQVCGDIRKNNVSHNTPKDRITVNHMIMRMCC
jgi:hypothetical protein